MSTRCLIGKKNEDKTITYVYCHFDGAPNWAGKTLLENYRDENKINQLLALGDMFVLGREPIAKKFDYTLPSDERERYCEPYSLRGEDVPATTVKTQKAFLAVDSWEEYWYLFKDNKWYYSSDGNTFKELTEERVKRD